MQNGQQASKSLAIPWENRSKVTVRIKYVCSIKTYTIYSLQLLMDSKQPQQTKATQFHFVEVLTEESLTTNTPSLSSPPDYDEDDFPPFDRTDA